MKKDWEEWSVAIVVGAAFKKPVVRPARELERGAKRVQGSPVKRASAGTYSESAAGQEPVLQARVGRTGPCFRLYTSSQHSEESRYRKRDYERQHTRREKKFPLPPFLPLWDESRITAVPAAAAVVAEMLADYSTDSIRVWLGRSVPACASRPRFFRSSDPQPVSLRCSHNYPLTYVKINNIATIRPFYITKLSSLVLIKLHQSGIVLLLILADSYF